MLKSKRLLILVALIIIVLAVFALMRYQTMQEADALLRTMGY